MDKKVFPTRKLLIVLSVFGVFILGLAVLAAIIYLIYSFNLMSFG